MSDITMCNGEGCEKRKTCFRYMAPADEYQSYFTEPPIKDGECEHFWNYKILSDKQ